VWLARSRLELKAQPTIPDRDVVRRRVLASGTMVGREIDLGIEADGRLVGEIQTHRAPGRGLAPGAFELGIVIHDPGDRGKGYGSEAMGLLVTWLFDQAEAKTVQAATETENEPMRRALEKLGFARAGGLREFGRDYVLYAVSEGDWRGLPDQP
jgi:RimJ/RimL family protein N-acetyltransferase